MERQVIVPPNVEDEYNSFGLPAEVGRVLFRRLETDLPEEYESVKLNRPADDDTIFQYRIVFALNDQWYTFSCWVNDTTSPDHLFVEAIEREVRPMF